VSASLPPSLSLKRGYNALAAYKRLANHVLHVSRLANVGATVTFVNGVLVGLLIPSHDWPAITTVIIVGVMLQTIVNRIETKSGNTHK
jgi:hypothetical protein